MESVALIGGLVVMLLGMYFVFFHMKDDLDAYQAEERDDTIFGLETFRVAISNVRLVPLVLKILAQERENHPNIQYVLTVGEEETLMESIQNAQNAVIVVSSTVAWMPNMTVRDVAVKPLPILLDEGHIALKPSDMTEQSQKIICRNSPSLLVDEFVQAFCACSV